MRTRRRYRAAMAIAAIVLVSGCVEKVETSTGGTGSGSGGATAAQGDSSAMTAMGGQNADGEPVVVKLADREFTFGPVPTEPIEATGEPIKLGMINQEGTPIGSFPELRLGSEAAAAFINAELGGVEGRPIEIVPCIATFSVEQSQSCAQRFAQDPEIVAVLGGIDLTSNGSVPILEQNELAYVGGIPVNFAEMQSDVSFQFSGGSPGAMAAMAWHAAEVLDAKRVVIAYGEYDPITAAAELGKEVAESLGVDRVDMVGFPIVATDFLPTLTKIKELEPDAVLVGAADTACAPFMKGAYDLGIDAQLYLTGACAAPTIADDVGTEAVEGRIFNIESPIDAEDSDGLMYFEAVAKYGDPQLSAASAATISFRSVMNLWSIMTDLGADDVSRASIIEALRATKDRPQFYGHAYTCDGRQIEEYPAMCAPQQILVRRTTDAMTPEGDWIDVPAIVADTNR